MNRALAILLLTTIAACAVAGPDSPFTLVSKETDALFHYSGQTSLKGHFVALGEISEFDDSEKPEAYLVVRLKVAKESAKLLPILRREAPSLMWLRNTDQAIDALMSPSLAHRLRAHKLQRVEGDAVVTVNSLVAEATCDQWGFSAEVVAASVRPAIVARVGPDVTSSGGC